MRHIKVTFPLLWWTVTPAVLLSDWREPYWWTTDKSGCRVAKLFELNWTTSEKFPGFNSFQLLLGPLLFNLSTEPR